MRVLPTSVVMAAIALGPGCGTLWIGLQASGGQRALDEQARDELVPMPGIDERLVISVPLVTEYTIVPGATPSTTPSTTAGPAKRFEIACHTEQRARSVQYHAAFRYGHAWKKGTALMFLLEGVAASVLLLEANTTDHADALLAGAFFAADAALTGAIFFIPRKEVYREEPIAVTTPVRNDCPDGLELEISGARYPVDAAGHVTDVAEAALGDWMVTPTGPIFVALHGQTQALPIGAREQCAWLRDRQPSGGSRCLPADVAPPRVVVTTLVLAPGTLATER
jgi:hypothetical protein